MPRDLFEELSNQGTSPDTSSATSSTNPNIPSSNGPRDLLEGMGMPQAPTQGVGLEGLGKPSIDPALAAVAGLSNAGANVIEGTVDAGAWLLDKMNIISPKFAEEMKKSVQEDMDTWFRSSDKTPQGDIVNEARLKHPEISAPAQAIGEVGILAGINPTSGLSGTAGKLADTALQSGAGALTSAGLAGPDTKDQDQAALIGAAIPPILSGLGTAVKAVSNNVANKLGLNKELSAYIEDVNKDLLANKTMDTTEKAAASIQQTANRAKQIEDANYSQIKAIPGTINTKDIISNIEKVGMRNLDDIQKNVIQDLSERASNINTMEDALALKRSISDQYKNFKVGKTTETIADEYGNITKSIDAQISQKAQEFGLGDAWKKAKKFHEDAIIPLIDGDAFGIAKAFANRQRNPQAYADAMRGFMSRARKDPAELKAALKVMGDQNGSKIMEQDFIKSTLGELSQTPEAFNKNTAFRQINKYINQFDGILSKDSINTLKGIKTVLEKGGATGAKTLPTESSQILTRGVGAALGGSLGNVIIPGGIGLTAGSAAGAIVAPKALEALSNMVGTPAGMMILKGIGQGKPWAKRAAQLLRAGAIEMNAKYNKGE